MNDHHLQLKVSMTELLAIPADTKTHHSLSIQLGSSTITSSRKARNLGVVIDDQLNFTDQIASTARSCRFILYNIRKIRPFLSEHATQVLVQALVLSRLDYCNALLGGLPACTTKPLQVIQNAAARVIFNEPKRAHVTPLFIKLHWLPIVARIKFKILLLAYKTTTGSAPPYLRSLLQTYVPARSLHSANELRLVVPSQKAPHGQHRPHAQQRAAVHRAHRVSAESYVKLVSKEIVQKSSPVSPVAIREAPPVPVGPVTTAFGRENRDLRPKRRLTRRIGGWVPTWPRR
ncbi:uncharacterized protein LOC130428419 isoform X2 [Triplophysa dalaica]|nr:uncharacterized protein LOC130428419 isoform X2 [Triplophysa dalaica]XP_056612412.1 uncharacterized protein LOC130428419 isoform X2 [Triplophysa dalaica]